MTNKEKSISDIERAKDRKKASKIAAKWWQNLIVKEDCNSTEEAIEKATVEAMQWKDKERKELWRITRNHYQEWAEEQIAQEKQQWIEKACEWLEGVRLDYYSKNIKEFIEDLKKVMEEL